MRVQKTLAHGDHNPQHGGQFFMAADSWHHIEGAYPSPGVFRLYLFDDYTKPLAADRIAAVKARVVTKEETNPQTFESREVTAVPLTPSPDGPYLEAAIDAVPLPASLIVQASFTAGSKDQRFDFTFTEHSVASAPTTIDGATRLAMDIPDDAGRGAGDAARAARPGEGDRRPRQPHRGVGAGAAGQGPGLGPRAARPRIPGSAAPGR